MTIYDWHRWFAWRPVSTSDGTIAFLRTIERMHTAPSSWPGVHSPYECDREGYWVYREPRA